MRRSTSAAASSGPCFARRFVTGNGSLRSSARSGRRVACRDGALDASCGQSHGKRAALAALAADFELGLVAEQDMLDDRKTESRAACRTRAAAVDTIKPLGQARHQFG